MPAAISWTLVPEVGLVIILARMFHTVADFGTLVPNRGLMCDAAAVAV
jgi:hypothetical protein